MLFGRHNYKQEYNAQYIQKNLREQHGRIQL